MDSLDSSGINDACKRDSSSSTELSMLSFNLRESSNVKLCMLSESLGYSCRPHAVLSLGQEQLLLTVTVAVKDTCCMAFAFVGKTVCLELC